MKNALLRALALSLALFMLTPTFAACGSNEEPEVTTADTAGSTAPVDPPVTKITVNGENIESVRLVRSDDLKTGSPEVSIFTAFSEQMRKAFGAQPELGTDFFKAGLTAEEADIEIVIGDTKREASKLFNDKLKAIGKPAYGISVSEGKICVSGTSVYLTYMALDHLLRELVTKDADGKAQISLDIGFELIEQAKANFPSLEEVMSSGREYALYSLGRLVKIPSQNGYSGIQGGGTDGKYAYYASINSSSAPGMAVIRKYDMTTWELVATSEPIPSEHSNDITYDSKNGRLVLSTCIAGDGYRGIVTVDPDTLKFIEYIEANYATRGVVYLPEKDQYLFAVSYGYAIMNDKFEFVSAFDDGYPNLTTQGLDVGGKYIFDPRWEPKAKHQTVVVHTVDGQFVGAIPLYGIEGEPENIICDGDSFIMGCNGSNSVFRLALLYKNWW